MLLWLPALRYPIVEDTAVYALLGRSFWREGTFTLLGEPFTRQLPFHAILSYPLTIPFGYQLGMKLSSLLAGIGVCIVSYFLFRRTVGMVAGLAVAALIALHPGFTYMTMVGSADLLFTFLFLLAILLYIKAKEDPRWYLAMGAATGLACLTRYNAVALFPLFLVAPILVRPNSDTPARRPYSAWWYWGGLALGILIFSLWFIRNTITFGNPFAIGYVGEFQQNTPGVLQMSYRNVLYYLNPAHNVFFLLFPFALYGLWKEGRRQLFLVLSMFAAWPLTLVWHVQGIRFAFPGYPILIGFSVLGIVAFLRWGKRWVPWLLVLLLAAFIVEHTFFYCIYAYGQCNAAFDRTVGLLPPNIGLSTEGFASWDDARDYINTHAETGALVAAGSPADAVVWQQGVFRPGLHVIGVPPVPCQPVYAITQHPQPGDTILYTSPDAPRASVVLQGCQ